MGVSSITEPLQRCGQVVWPGRVSALTGTADRGLYQPIVRGGADSCERIMAWWDEITHAEAQRSASGDYPCEYPAAYSIWPRGLQTNGPPMLVGCWPRLLYLEGECSDDPDQEAARLRHLEGAWIIPPNHPPLVEALWNCYRDALQGPPPDWQRPPGGEWPTVLLCHYTIDGFGNPVRYMGVTPDCAANQFLKQIQERKQHGWIGGAQYAGDFSWATCSTTASRLLPPGLGTFTERCEAIIDASIRPAQTDAIAQHHGLTQAAYISEIKAMYCPGTRPNLLNYPQHHGDWVASWLPPEGTVCWQAALLSAAHTAAYGQWTTVKFC